MQMLNIVSLKLLCAAYNIYERIIFDMWNNFRNMHNWKVREFKILLY